MFSWLGNVDLLLAIIKLLEDKMNADNDINGVGVQMILLCRGLGKILFVGTSDCLQIHTKAIARILHRGA